MWRAVNYIFRQTEPFHYFSYWREVFALKAGVWLSKICGSCCEYVKYSWSWGDKTMILKQTFFMNPWFDLKSWFYWVCIAFRNGVLWNRASTTVCILLVGHFRLLWTNPVVKRGLWRVGICFCCFWASISNLLMGTESINNMISI